MKLIQKYFPQLSNLQIQQFDQLMPLYQKWNASINVISRKDIDNLYERHVLHSLSIAKVIEPKPGTSVLDVGTGGGFPGIPLAILFPSVDFLLIDSVAKKVKVTKAIAKDIGLSNMKTDWIRAENLKGSFHFIVTRAVKDLNTILDWTNHLISKDSFNPLGNGWLLLKGGEVENEIRNLKKKVTKYAISDYFSESFFISKYVLHLPN